MKKVALINGVNLDRLGTRQPEIYGSTTLKELTESLRVEALAAGAEIVDFQSNYEGAIVDKIVELSDSGVELGIINPGAFAHTSIAIRDCIAGCKIRFVEVHISNIYSREEFRHNSYTAGACEGVITGLGLDGYSMALRHLLK